MGKLNTQLMGTTMLCKTTHEQLVALVPTILSDTRAAYFFAQGCGYSCLTLKVTSLIAKSANAVASGKPASVVPAKAAILPKPHAKQSLHAAPKAGKKVCEKRLHSFNSFLVF